MGTVCSAQKSQQKQNQKQQELNIVDAPYLESHSLPPKSKQQEFIVDNALGQSVQDLLLLFKKFTDMLGLVGSLDHLPQHTRDKLNGCIILRSNISIIIQNNIKRIMREQQIIKRVEESDYYLVHNDEKFGTTFTQQMQKLSNIILTELKPDEDFECAFPMLIVNFEEIAIQTNSIIEKYKAAKKMSFRKGSAQQQISVDQKTTKKPQSLQQ